MKATMRYHLTPVTVVILKKTGNNKFQLMWRKGNPCALLVGLSTGASTMKNSLEVSQEVKNAAIT